MADSPIATSNSKTSSPKLAMSSFNKENDSQKGAPAKATFPKPPPQSNNNGMMYCSRILQPQSANNNALQRTEYTCECCRPFNVDEESDDDDEEVGVVTKPRPSSRAAIVEDSEDDDEQSVVVLSDDSSVQDEAKETSQVPDDKSKTKAPQPPKPRWATLMDSSSDSDSSFWENMPTISIRKVTTQKDKEASTTPQKTAEGNTNTESQSTIKSRRRIESSSDDDYEFKGKPDGFAPEEDNSDKLVDLMKRVTVNDDNPGKKPPSSYPTGKKKTTNPRQIQDLTFSDEEEEHDADYENEEPFAQSSADEDDFVVVIDSDDEDSEDEYDKTTRERTSSPPPTRRVKGPPKKGPTKQSFLKRTTASSRQMGGKAFKQQREQLAAQTFARFNKDAFDMRLSSVELIWSNKLKTTAGLTRLMSVRRGTKVEKMDAKIELATKIIDNMDRLESTLLHEMCHAAAWLVDGVAKPAHGACFKKWSKLAMKRIPGVEVTTTHRYEIAYKYAWACENPLCNVVVKRHSRSVDVKRQCCGKCKGNLIEIEQQSQNGKTSAMGHTPKKKAPLSAYNLFVQQNSKQIREELIAARRAKGMTSQVPQGEVLKECARLWKEQKAML